MKKHVSLKIKYRKKYSTAQMYKKKKGKKSLFFVAFIYLLSLIQPANQRRPLATATPANLLKIFISAPFDQFIHKKSKSKRAKQAIVTKTTKKGSFKQGRLF